MSSVPIAATMAFIEVSMLSWTTDLGVVRKEKSGDGEERLRERRREGRTRFPKWISDDHGCF